MEKQISKELLEFVEFHEIDLNNIDSVHYGLGKIQKRIRHFKDELRAIINSDESQPLMLNDYYEKLLWCKKIDKELTEIYINL